MAIPPLDIDLEELEKLYPRKEPEMEYQGLHTNPTETQKIFHNFAEIDRRVYRLETGQETIIQKLDDNTAKTIAMLELVNTVTAFRKVGVVTRAIFLWVSAAVGGMAAVYEICVWVVRHA